MIELILCLILGIIFIGFASFVDISVNNPVKPKVVEKETIEPFFGENIPAPEVLIASGLAEERPDGSECVHEGVERLFDYSNRFIDAQHEASRIFTLPPSQPGESVCR